MKSFKELIDLANAEIDSITTEDLAKEINENNVVVPQLYTAGWIKRGPSGIIGTNKACANETDQSEGNPFKKSELDPNKKIVVYCGVGGQGALSAKTLKDMGFKNVSNLKGGVKAWKNSGQKTTKVSSVKPGDTVTGKI